ncbi:hypothetical protein RvY_15147 [Ramazzottius varieornatus]|uniref:Reverse transcriptase domain-containing protein n=1 Tax=Ramazzottius varieornatus TaxID=947166 RepID=A0A1D1VYP5_RAMVA|nr:hypothetical protein RvY_15147 [Ramazzottius varieornatus]
MQAVASTRNIQKFWKLSKSTADIQNVPPLWNDGNGSFEFEDPVKANLLDKWFASCQQPCSSHCVGPPMPTSPSDFPDPITHTDILSALKHVLVPGKACGPFPFSFDLLSHCGSEIVAPLIMLFNTCLFSGIFPGCWKTSYVTPIPKGSLNSTKCANWHQSPSSILCPNSSKL